MSDIIKERGLPFFAHLLRRLSDDFVRGLTTWAPEAGMLAPPRTASTMQVLHVLGPLTVTEIAQAIRQSQPLVTTWIRQLKELEFIEREVDPMDGRRTLISLSKKGQAEIARQEEALASVAAAYHDLLEEAKAEVFDALWRVEAANRRLPFADRLRGAAARIADEATH